MFADNPAGSWASVMKLGIRILVLDRGFVVIGEVETHPQLAYHWLVTGRTVRRWGTANGLSELTAGPLANTILDPIATRDVPWRAVIEMLHASEDAWRPHLNIAAASAGGSRPQRTSTVIT